MSISSRIAENQPESFAFTAQNKKRIKEILGKYPKERKASAVMPLLDLAQRQHDNWIPMKAIEEISSMLGMAEIRVLEVATFYTMFNLRPVGRYYIQACGTTPCWLRGSDDVMRSIYDKLGIRTGETSACGKFTLLEVECLGACVNAPMVQINDDYYEDLDYISMGNLIDQMEAGELPSAGSLRGRQGSQPEPGATTLDTVIPMKTANNKAKTVSKGDADAG
ncbi:MAG: NADH-quinone oxidoreductase subunit NuoE [SAR116 cluster bacterium MED-G04]|jgi:NADH-quinone oxidoreductase E subunit|nr:MAG: NADH-quinone oxidoreductase subunit NuoE [SAR116 cluster bacterium MED-G04]|tara:strand:- start:2931 stop:3596 length:666 start_codon:yes stop_codon:yes gene_type:complete